MEIVSFLLCAPLEACADRVQARKEADPELYILTGERILQMVDEWKARSTPERADCIVIDTSVSMDEALAAMLAAVK